jgi:type II secretion system protein N
MDLTARQRKILKVVGLVALGLFAFVFALAQTFPYDRLKDRLIDELSDKYDVSIDDIHAGWLPGTVIIEGFSLKTRPTKEDEKPTAVFIDEVEIDIGILALITRRYVVDVTASVTGGEIEVAVEMSKSELDVEIRTSSLPLQNVPGLAGVVGLPMGGPLDAKVDLEVPIKKKGKRSEFKWTEAEGSVSIQCTGCTAGDGQAKLKMKPRAGASRRLRQRALFAAEGITVPRLSLGNAVVEIEIAGGIGKINAFSAKSKDGELSLDGEVRFAEPFKRSTLPGCMRFKLSDALKQREPNFGNIEFTLPPRARQDDGSFAIPTKGNLGRFGLNHRKQCDDPGGSSGDRPTASKMPKLTVPPSKAERVGSPASRGDDDDDDEPVDTPEPGTSGPDLGAARLRDVAQKVADKKAAEEAGDEAGDEGESEGEGQGEGDQGEAREGFVEGEPAEGEGEVIEDEGEVVEGEGEGTPPVD